MIVIRGTGGEDNVDVVTSQAIVGGDEMLTVAASHGSDAGVMSGSRRTSVEEARRVGDVIGVDWSRFDLEQFRAGMDVEYEHGSRDPQTDVTGDDPIVTGKIALAHMKEFPDYYERLARMERQAEADWAGRSA